MTKEVYHYTLDRSVSCDDAEETLLLAIVAAGFNATRKTCTERKEVAA